MVFPELENAYGEGRRMEHPVLASLSLGDLCDIERPGRRLKCGYQSSVDQWPL